MTKPTAPLGLSIPHATEATLRDYFAAYALASPLIILEAKPSYVARVVYEIADAMLAERAK